MAEAVAELTIDELARETGMTVRNIRAHQSRGLLPPPEVRARTGYYGPEHVARLRLIQELQANGYNLAAIKRPLRADVAARPRTCSTSPARCWRRSRTSGPRSSTPSSSPSASPGSTSKALRRAEKLGIVVPLGEGRYEVPSPTLLRAGETLVGSASRSRSARGRRGLARQADSVAERSCSSSSSGCWKPFDRAGQPEPDCRPCSRSARSAAPARHRGRRGDSSSRG